MKVESRLPHESHNLEVGDVFQQSCYPSIKQIVTYFFYKGFYPESSIKHETESGVFRITKIKNRE